MDQTVGHTHGDARPAELAAALAVAPHLKKMKASIVTAVAAAGDHGRTPDEYQQQAGGLINTVRRRFTDLWKEGQLRPTDRTRPNARGNPETVWVVGRDEKAMGARPATPARIREAVLTLLKKNGGPIDGYVANDRGAGVWTKDAYVMVRREDFDALDQLTRPAKPCPMLGAHNGDGTPTLGCTCPAAA